VQRALQQLAVLDSREHLDAPSAVGGWAEAHEVQLARVADPRGAVQRTVEVLTPPQPDVELARADATLVGRVEARQRVITLARRYLYGDVCCADTATPSFDRRFVDWFAGKPLPCA
jgi:hypothetical protein